MKVLCFVACGLLVLTRPAFAEDTRQPTAQEQLVMQQAVAIFQMAGQIDQLKSQLSQMNAKFKSNPELPSNTAPPQRIPGVPGGVRIPDEEPK
jgi:hypothetical protein